MELEIRKGNGNGKWKMVMIVNNRHEASVPACAVIIKPSLCMIY